MIILNELEYAEKCLRGEATNESPYSVLAILAKYFYHYKGYKKSQIITELTKYLTENYPALYSDRRAAWDESIEKLASGAKKYTLYEIDGIWVTKSEMETIQNIHSKVLERLAFTMLCLAKLALRKNGNANGWVNDDAKTIFSLARISGSVVDRYCRISDLVELGLLESPKKNGLLSYRVTFIDDKSENILFVHDFRELGYEYLKYTGQNIIRCAECGILTRGNKSGTKRYCSSCAGYIPQKIKKITCIDCGKEFEISSKNNKTCRCEKCKKKYENEDARLRMIRYKLGDTYIPKNRKKVRMNFGDGKLYGIKECENYENIKKDDLYFLGNVNSFYIERFYNMDFHYKTEINFNFFDNSMFDKLGNKLSLAFFTENNISKQYMICIPNCTIIKVKDGHMYIRVNAYCDKNERNMLYIREDLR